MNEPLTQLKLALKEQGKSLTHPREAVFMALQNQEPQTVQQLVTACPLIDRASVYRTIALFEQLGVIQRLQIGWKYKLELSDSFHHHHHHLTCRHCGTTTSLPEDRQLEERLAQLAAAQNFAMSNHQIEIDGHCQNCFI
jgi:Fur family transcriptional regulator, ferric uptake regulator